MCLSRLLACLLLLAPWAALAQTSALGGREPSRGVTLPPTSAALADEATAIAVNPAGLMAVGTEELFFVHERDVARNQVADGLFLSMPLGRLGSGFSVDWVRGTQAADYRRTSWGLAVGSPRLALGAAYRFFHSDEEPAYDPLGSLDVGVLFRPYRGVSLGAVVQNLDQQARGGVVFTRRYDLGLGVRPFGEWLTLAADYVFPHEPGPHAGRLAYTLRAEVLRGFFLAAGFSHGLRSTDELLFQLSITVDGSHAGITYAGGASVDGLNHTFALRASSRPYRGISISAGKLAVVDVAERLSPDGGRAALSLLGRRTRDPFIRLSRFLDEASRDPELQGVLLKLDNLSDTGLGTIHELRQGVLRLRERGKRVIAVLLSGGDSEYLLASAADRIYVVPGADLPINGLLASVLFAGGTMEKLDVKWDVARVGAYKNAPDSLTRSSMSPEQRESLEALLDTDQRNYEQAVQKARNISPEKLREILAEGLLTPARAKETGMVDEIVTAKQLEERIEELLPDAWADDRYQPGREREDRWGTRRRIAIVPVIGTISGGESRGGTPLDGQVAGAETVIDALARAAADPKVIAIVLRVDSPGGSGLASDLIYRAVLEAKERKPVVASMGDMAASGGYYVAMGADELLASPTTVTGSIGVFILKPALEGLAGKLGVTRELLVRAPKADLLGWYRPWSPEEQAAAQRWAESFYDVFITEAARMRGMSKEQVDAVARGRVWSGEDARERGLVDKLGDLQAALEAARRRAEVPEAEELDIEVFGEGRSPLSSFGGMEESLARALGGLLPEPEPPPALAALARELGLEPLLLQPPGVKAMMPFTVRVE